MTAFLLSSVLRVLCRAVCYGGWRQAAPSSTFPSSLGPSTAHNAGVNLEKLPILQQRQSAINPQFVPTTSLPASPSFYPLRSTLLSGEEERGLSTTYIVRRQASPSRLCHPFRARVSHAAPPEKVVG